jgi:hypothetical protein
MRIFNALSYNKATCDAVILLLIFVMEVVTGGNYKIA